MCAAIAPRMASACRAVNAWLTIRRQRVWPGGSDIEPPKLKTGLDASAWKPVSTRAAPSRLMVRLKRWSVRAARTSSYRVISQAVSPLSRRTWLTGRFARSQANSSGI